MKKIDNRTVEIANKQIHFDGDIKDTIEFDRCVVFFIDDIDNGTKQVYSIDKKDGSILWNKWNSVVILIERSRYPPIITDQSEIFVLKVNLMGYAFYIEPYTGKFIGEEQVK
jgi:hypothetical protein